MKKNILIIYYSQTGQLSDITDSLLTPLKNREDIQINYYEIKPKHKYPFPWTAYEFFDVFPESVLNVACDLENPDITIQSYDLIVLAYQVWYLSPSIPVFSFLQTDTAKLLFKNTPVITVIGCRNMWIMAQEKIKQQLFSLQSKLVGNLVFYDKAPNIVSVVTISAWLVGGIRENFLGIFPRSGVSIADISEASKFGRSILQSLQSSNYKYLQTNLNKLGAIQIVPGLMLLEKRGIKIFEKWAKFIRQKGGPMDQRRAFRVRLFATCLPSAILLLFPVKTISSFLILTLFKKNIKKEIQYYSQNSLEI